jgi:hypothetical protein
MEVFLADAIQGHRENLGIQDGLEARPTVVFAGLWQNGLFA